MSVYSAVVRRNPLNFVTLIGATQYASTLHVFVPPPELWISHCQYKLRSDVNDRWHYRLHTSTRLCQRQQLCSYTQSQEWIQMWQQSSDQLTRCSSLVPILKESVSKTVLCIIEFYHQILQQASVIATKGLQFALTCPETISVHPFCNLDNTQIILEINSTHQTPQYVQPLTNNLVRGMHTLPCLPSCNWLTMRNRFYHTSAVVKAGHNKWSKVKHKKKVTDLEKSVTIHKYMTLIVSAIKVGGGSDPDSNVRLAGIIESARKAGM